MTGGKKQKIFLGFKAFSSLKIDFGYLEGVKIKDGPVKIQVRPFVRCFTGLF